MGTRLGRGRSPGARSRLGSESLPRRRGPSGPAWRWAAGWSGAPQPRAAARCPKATKPAWAWPWPRCSGWGAEAMKLRPPLPGGAQLGLKDHPALHASHQDPLLLHEPGHQARPLGLVLDGLPLEEGLVMGPVKLQELGAGPQPRPSQSPRAQGRWPGPRLRPNTAAGGSRWGGPPPGLGQHRPKKRPPGLRQLGPPKLRPQGGPQGDQTLGRQAWGQNRLEAMLGGRQGLHLGLGLGHQPAHPLDAEPTLEQVVAQLPQGRGTVGAQLEEALQLGQVRRGQGPPTQVLHRGLLKLSSTGRKAFLLPLSTFH
jgi:hypothetical protein